MTSCNLQSIKFFSWKMYSVCGQVHEHLQGFLNCNFWLNVNWMSWLDASPTATNSPLLAAYYLPWRLPSIFFLFGSFLGKGKRIGVLLQMRQTVGARVSFLTFPFRSFSCCGFCFFVFRGRVELQNDVYL